MKIKKYIVAIITAVCLLALAYVWSLDKIKLNFILANAPFFVFFIYLINSKKIINNNKNIFIWSGIIILVTIAIILIQII